MATRSTLGKDRSEVSKWTATVDADEIEVACTRWKTIPLDPIAGSTQQSDTMTSNNGCYSFILSRGERRKSAADSVLNTALVFFMLGTLRRI